MQYDTVVRGIEWPDFFLRFKYLNYCCLLSLNIRKKCLSLSSEETMFIEVIKADYMDGYRLLLLFNNGERRIVDLSDSLKGTVYTPLKDIDYFKRFSIKFNTVEWENGADFAPEYLYEISTAA